MNKILTTECIGEFFSKMYEANKGKQIHIELRPDEERIAIYYKEKGTFDYIVLTDEKPSIEGLVKSISNI